MSRIVTKGYGGKQLLLFGYSDILESGAISGIVDFNQAPSAFDIIGNVYEIIVPFFIIEPLRKRAIRGKCDFIQPSCEIFAEGKLSISGDVKFSQIKSGIKSRGEIIAITDEEIAAFLLAA